MKSAILSRSFVFASVAALTWCATAAAPSVTLGTVSSHDPWDGRFDVPYTLSNTDPACEYRLAFEVTAAGKTAAATNAAARVTDGVYTNTLDTAELFGRQTSDAAARVRVVLIAVKPEGTPVSDAVGTAIGALGDVMVIDVSAGPMAGSYPVTYYDGVDFGAFNCDTYKTTRIVLRKIAAGTAYYAGPGATNDLTELEKITPVKDYYIGLFPITVAQYALVTGEGDTSAKTPKGAVSWNSLRGGVATATAITASSEAGFFQKLCARCGMNGFDLPTDVQWDIAARAGSPSRLGVYLKDFHETAATVDLVDDYAVTGSVQVVGTKCPNLWGLYDTIGNVAELCRDDYRLLCDRTDAETPYAADTTTKVLRGGDYGLGAAEMKVSQRANAVSYVGSARNGFRLVRNCP